MIGAQYIFCLQDKNYNFWSINASGQVVLSPVPYLLDFSPDGWNEIAVQNIVNKVYKGIDRSVTIPLKYVKDGSKILKHIFYEYGINAEVFLSVASQQLNYTPGVSYGFWYKRIFRGAVDWTTYNHDGAIVTCTTLEDGLPKHLKANDKTVYEFPMNVPEAVYVKLDGINLHEKLNYLYPDGIDIAVNNGTSNGQILPLLFINNEGDSVGVAWGTQNYQYVGLSSNVFTAAETNNFLFNAGAFPATFTITGTIQVLCTQRTASSTNVVFRIGVGQTGGTITSFALNSAINMIQGQTYTVPYTLTYTLQPNQYMFMYATSSLSGSSCIYQLTAASSHKVTFISRYSPTYIRAFRPQYLFGLLIQKLTNGEYAAAISAFLTANEKRVITCGNAVRGLNDAVMKISVENFFKFFDSVYSVALVNTTGNIVDIGEEHVLADLVNVIDIPGPARNTFKVTVNKDLLLNQLKIGYPEIKNEIGVLNGNQEWNTEMLFGTDGTIATGTLEKISPIKTSCYEIEKIRITTFDKNTTDFKADNDLFAIDCDTVLQAASTGVPVHYLLDRTLNAFVTDGLFEPSTVFNLWFSPKRNFLRSGPSIRGRFYKSNSLLIKFRSADKNSYLECNGIEEKADVAVGSLDMNIATPIMFDYECPVTQSPISLLEINPLRAFRFPFEGQLYIGLLSKISSEASTRKTQQIQLRSAQVNDLTHLKNYDGQ